MKMTTTKVASKSKILTSWVDSYAATAHVVVADGQARGSLSPYGCILEYNIMQGYIINVVGGAIASVNHI